jgi:hypothetical protein
VVSSYPHVTSDNAEVRAYVNVSLQQQSLQGDHHG